MRGNSGQHCMITQENIFQSELMLQSYKPRGLLDEFVDEDMTDESIRSAMTFSAEYFGDNVDWEGMREFKLTELYESKNIRQESIKLADEIKMDIKFHSEFSIEEFECCEDFQLDAGIDAQNIWNQEIARGSAPVLLTFDQLNIFLNGGNLTVNHIEFGYRDRELQPLRTLSEWEQNLDDNVYKTLPWLLQYQRGQILSYLGLISSQATCLYDALEGRNSSMTRIFTKNVAREKFVLFVSEFLESLERLVRSEKTVEMIQMFYTTLKSEIKSYDHNALTAEMYLTFLQTRRVLLNIDMKTLFDQLNEIVFTIAHSVWKLKTGQWPEMEKFVDNFFRKTYASREFWARLDGIYQKYLEEQREVYERRKRNFENALDDDIIPFFKMLKTTLDDVSEGDKELITNFFKELDFPLMDKIRILNSFIGSRNYFSCWAAEHFWPDYDQLAREISEQPDVAALNALVFSDWPEEDIFPASFQKFCQEIHTKLWLIISALFGHCPANNDD